jgi:hypothetical protein
MDTMSVLALAGAVIQFIDFGTNFLSKVVSGKGEIYKAMREGSIEDGFSMVDTVVGRDMKMISTITAKIQRPRHLNGSSIATSGDEKALIELCEECDTIADEFINRLEGLKTKSSQIKNQKNWKIGMDNRTNNFLSVFKAIWTKDKLNDTSKRFSMMKRALEVNILVSIGLEPILFSFLIFFQVLTHCF